MTQFGYTMMCEQSGPDQLVRDVPVGGAPIRARLWLGVDTLQKPGCVDDSKRQQGTFNIEVSTDCHCGPSPSSKGQGSSHTGILRPAVLHDRF